MPLSNGSRLGPYEILAPLGAGGMGEVYRARDTKLNREVAIKVLPSAVAQDAERMARFQREAQTLAALNHPNIGAVYGFEDNALIMEYVPGQTLAGPLPSDEAMGVVRQIADALEYAHERGIVHRDLKPANIKMTPEGVVKVLDFGLAKALEDSPAAQNIANSPTLSLAATKAGIILGTPAYMSPEQARGKPVDKRTDIWAFGCVLYELLTGKRAFDGETVTDVMAAVVNRDPDWSTLPVGSPAAIVRRCLVKDPKKRLRDIGDAFGETQAVAPATEIRPGPAARWKMAAAFVTVVGIALAIGMWLQSRRRPPVNEWTGTLLTSSISAMGPRIAPDGRTLAFQAMVDRMTQVAIMKPDTGNWTVLTHDRTKGYVVDIHWSADSGTIYFDRWNSTGPGGIFSIPAVGGAERLVLEDANAASVLPDGSFLMVRKNAERQLQLHRYWPETGRLQAFPALVLGAITSLSAHAFGDGKEAVFYGTTTGQSQADPLPHYYFMDLASGTTRRSAFESSGAEVPALAVDPNRHRFFFTVAKSGDLYDVVAVPRDGSGIAGKLISLTLPPFGLDIAPDGTFYLDQTQRPFEAVRFPATGGTPERLAHSEYRGSRLVLELPDGRVLFSSGLAGLERLMVAEPGQDPVALMDTKEETRGPAASLGTRELVLLMGRGANCRLAIVSSKDGRLVRRLDGNAERVTSAVGSKDGKTIYYVDDGIIWAIPAEGGTRQRLGTGDSLAIAPDGGSLVVQLNEKEGGRLVRLPLGGGDPQAIPQSIPMTGPFRLTSWPLAPGAVGPDGRIVVTAVADTWFYNVAILDPKTGKVQVVPLNNIADFGTASWTRDGRIIAQSQPLHSVLWRFRRTRNQP